MDDTTIAGDLIQLLDGEFVRIETSDTTIIAEVIAHSRKEISSEDNEPQAVYKLQLQPTSGSNETDADRFSITVAKGSFGEQVGPLVGAIFDETALEYRFESYGEVTGMEIVPTR